MPPHKQRAAVVDASAVLAFLFKEPGAEVVQRILPLAVISAANVTEVLTKAAARAGDKPGAEAAVMGTLISIGLAVQSNTEDDCLRAAELIAASRAPNAARSLSLGDALCLATAERLNLRVIGNDQPWETLDLKIEYMPYRS